MGNADVENNTDPGFIRKNYVADTEFYHVFVLRYSILSSEITMSHMQCYASTSIKSSIINKLHWIYYLPNWRENINVFDLMPMRDLLFASYCFLVDHDLVRCSFYFLFVQRMMCLWVSQSADNLVRKTLMRYMKVYINV